MRLQIPILLLLMLGAAAPLPGQTLPLKTVASPRGEQFLFLPTSNVGLGALSIATDDPFGDPFKNPAVRGETPLRVFFTPTLYGDSQETVSGGSLPLSATLSGSSWFGAIALAVQRLEDNPKQIFMLPLELDDDAYEGSHGRNSYFLGSLGRKVGSGTSIGFQVAYGEMGLVDGARRLYPGALSVSQGGHVQTLTLGAVHSLGDYHQLRATVYHSALAMSHKVTGWRPGGSSTQAPQLWTEEDEDRSEVLEVRIRYTFSIPSRGLRLGASAALQARTQSEIPDYELVHIPRDPGTSTVGELGLGMEAVGPLMRLGLEVALAPGTGHTRILSDSTVQSADRKEIQAGEASFENDFSFRNWRAAVGVDVPMGRGGIQLGLGFNGYGFRLDQRDLVRAEDHDRNVSWREWVPSAGGRISIGQVELGYSVRLVNKGTSPCEWFSFRNSCQTMPVPYHFTGLRVAPTEPEILPDFRVTTHQLTLSMPLG